MGRGRLILRSIGLAAGVVFAAGAGAVGVVNQNVVVTSGAQDAINGFAELRVLSVERVIGFGFGSGKSHSATSRSYLLWRKGNISYSAALAGARKIPTLTKRAWGTRRVKSGRGYRPLRFGKASQMAGPNHPKKMQKEYEANGAEYGNGQPKQIYQNRRKPLTGLIGICDNHLSRGLFSGVP